MHISSYYGPRPVAMPIIFRPREQNSGRKKECFLSYVVHNEVLADLPHINSCQASDPVFAFAFVFVGENSATPRTIKYFIGDEEYGRTTNTNNQHTRTRNVMTDRLWL